MRTHPPKPPGRRGFTLVELLIVMVILAIVIALAVAIGRYLTEESTRQRVKAAQVVLRKAISRYHEERAEYPAESYRVNNKTYRNTEALLKQLEEVPACWEAVQNIETEVLVRDDGDWQIRDPFTTGEQMEYDINGGSANTPVLISRGPDGKLNTEDDIRSDGR